MSDTISVNVSDPDLGIWGYLMVNNGTGWRGVCHEDFYLRNANVICRMLGYGPSMKCTQCTTMPIWWLEDTDDMKWKEYLEEPVAWSYWYRHARDGTGLFAKFQMNKVNCKKDAASLCDCDYTERRTQLWCQKGYVGIACAKPGHKGHPDNYNGSGYL